MIESCQHTIEEHASTIAHDASSLKHDLRKHIWVLFQFSIGGAVWNCFMLVMGRCLKAEQVFVSL
jgi:hypothetical protein